MQQPSTSSARAVRLLAIALIAMGVSASEIRAELRMYQGSWIAESFGNDVTSGPSFFSESTVFSVFGIPQGQICNPAQPRCPFSQTPVSVQPASKLAHFDPVGSLCTPLTAFGLGPTRPAKGATATTGGFNHRLIPPLYRNSAFFTPGGSPKTTSCRGTTTVGGGKATNPLTTNSPLRGKVMKGAPVQGTGSASTSGVADPRSFTLPAAAATPTAPGMRRTTLGEFNRGFPYLYSYTYAQLRNDVGTFSQGGGFFSALAAPNTLSFPYNKGGVVAKAVVKKGPNSFGGVMRLLGSITRKACYFRNGGCSLGSMNWGYDAIGASGYKAGGVLTAPSIFTYSAQYYHSALMQASTVMALGERFPWTTGSVTVTAAGRGPHRTIERRKGYDNRVKGVGTIQLVSPVVTRWLQPSASYETSGIAVLRFKFLPEPGTLIALVAGLSLLSVLYRIRS
jgi:hypothetical protein